MHVSVWRMILVDESIVVLLIDHLLMEKSGFRGRAVVSGMLLRVSTFAVLT